MKTITLDAEFADENGKSHHLKLKQFDPTKTADQIKAALTKLTKLNLFEKDGVALFKKVLHARIIVQEVQTLFDDREENAADDPMAVMLESAGTEPVVESPSVKEEPQPRSVKNTGQVRFPEDFTITEAHPKPGWLIKTIELPPSVHPQDINENQAMMMIQACLPSGVVSVEDLVLDDESTPAKLIITARYEEEAKEAIVSVNKESPPEKPKKKRKRLLNRMRKRE